MKKLYLTKGKYTIVDDKDYDSLSQWKWSFLNSGGGYAVRNSKGKIILLHRQIMNYPKEGIDHKNGDSLDNRRCNLRVCDQLSNTKNSSSHRDSLSKYKGVTWQKGLNKWRSRIMFNGIVRNIGVFNDETEAAISYNNMAKKYHGEFARLNIV